MRRAKPRGVSLLEIIIAMQITALLLVMVCRVLPLARRQMREADRHLGGALICQSTLEEHLTIAVEQWPRERIQVADEPYQFEIEALEWEHSNQLKLAQVRLYLGEEEVYRLETAVLP